MPLGLLSGFGLPFGRGGDIGIGGSNIEGGLSLPKGFTGNAGRRDTTRADYFTTVKTFSDNNGTVFEELGAVKCNPQQALRWGYGTPKYSDNQGLVYILAKSNPTQATMDGYYRLSWKDFNKFRNLVVKEFRSETLRGSQTVRDQQVFFPEQPIRGLAGRDYALQDEFLAIDYKSDSVASQILSTTGTTLTLSQSQYFL